MLGFSLGIVLSKIGRLRGFSPSTLFASGEQGAWYDPSDMSTLFQDSAGTTPVTASGQPVGLMLDKSGRGNHATQATAASRPTYTVSGGLSYLAFDGVDDFMVTPTITPGVDKVQVFAGVRKLSDAARGMMFETIAAAGGVRVEAPHIAANASFMIGTRGSLDPGPTISPLTYAAPVTVVFSGIGEIATDTSILRLNGAQVTSNVGDQGIGNYASAPFYIGNRGGTSLPFNGNLYGLTVRFGANLSAGQIAQAETYMAAKTRVTL